MGNASRRGDDDDDIDYYEDWYCYGYCALPIATKKNVGIMLAWLYESTI